MNPTITEPEDSLVEAVLRTLLYADVFGFAMTQAEIHHFLIGLRASSQEVAAVLQESAYLAQRIQSSNGYYALQDNAVIAQRETRNVASVALWPAARRWGRILAHLPFIRMVAITGALAMYNSKPSDDIDYLLVTVPGHTWTARAFSVLLVRLARFWHIVLCPNYVLAESALLQNKQNLFIAHELAQMVPLAGLPLYKKLRTENEWSLPLMPNTGEPFYHVADFAPYGIGKMLQRLAEFILTGPLGDRLEHWEQQRKMRKFEAQAHKDGSAAQLDGQRIKGHFNDYGDPALEQYRQRLIRYGLAANLEYRMIPIEESQTVSV